MKKTFAQTEHAQLKTDTLEQITALLSEYYYQRHKLLFESGLAPRQLRSDELCHISDIIDRYQASKPF